MGGPGAGQWCQGGRQLIEQLRLGVQRQADDREVGPGVPPLAHRGDERVEVSAAAHLARAGDLAEVPAHCRAVLPEDFLELGVLGQVLGRPVPLRGVASGGAQGALAAIAADGDRRVRALHRLGLAARACELHVLPVVVRHGLREQRDDRLDALIEPVEPLLQRRQRDAVGGALHLVPRGAKAEDQPATRDVVHGGGHVGQDGRMPVGHAGDLAANPDTVGAGRHRRQHRPALEVRASQVAGQRVEVVPVPDRLKQRVIIGRDPYVEELLPGLVLGPCLERETHAVLPSSVWFHP